MILVTPQPGFRYSVISQLRAVVPISRKRLGRLNACLYPWNSHLSYQGESKKPGAALSYQLARKPLRLCAPPNRALFIFAV